jgi:hypothetical protein
LPGVNSVNRIRVRKRSEVTMNTWGVIRGTKITLPGPPG